MYVVVSMDAGRHNVYFDVLDQTEPGIFSGTVAYHTTSVLMNTENSRALREEAQAVADRLNALEQAQG